MTPPSDRDLGKKGCVLFLVAALIAGVLGSWWACGWCCGIAYMHGLDGWFDDD